MPFQIIVGAQWGDEGKGRIVDWYAAGADVVARFNGGDNAGHTVTVGEQTFKLHLIPSGAVHPKTIAMLGNGMVINPATLLGEMGVLRAAGLEISSERLKISYAAHLITPAHKALDQAQERARGKASLGTTGRGIGPAYTDKAARRGLRMQDMLDPAGFGEKMEAHIEEANRRLKGLYGADELIPRLLVQEYREYAELLAPYIADTSSLLDQALDSGQTVMAEGAQGTLLDLDQGTYPFVTSSTTTAAGAFTGLGLGIRPVEQIIGVTKCFQTRVGSGPFPTEVFETTAERLRGTGANPWDEFGTTTGRPRRVGWLDCVLLRFAVRVNGLTELALTKLDILSGLNTLRIGIGYRSGDQEYSQLPLGPADLSPFQPVYAELPGWQADLRGLRRWAELPEAAQTFIRSVEKMAGIPVKMVSVGPEREQIIRVEPA
ncbi:MAG TPA: adenylosuccinate synthase [Anaerolineaceae bacterium]|nr:adenylosuccinate synthase [Anaerolineaceae bacterium]